MSSRPLRLCLHGTTSQALLPTQDKIVVTIGKSPLKLLLAQEILHWVLIPVIDLELQAFHLLWTEYELLNPARHVKTESMLERNPLIVIKAFPKYIMKTAGMS